MPLGTAGRLTLDGIEPLAVRIGQAARDALAGPPTRREIELTVDGVRLTGAVAGVGARGLVVAQYSRIRGRHELRCWIRHLALSASGMDLPAILVGRNASKALCTAVRFDPVDDPRQLLETLLALYRRGQEWPLPFFQKASRTYAEQVAKGRSEGQALTEAEKAYAPSDRAQADGDDASVAQVYPNGAPFAAGGAPRDDFAATALAVFAPFFGHRSEATT